jgi:hypothetical protein
MSDPSSSLPRQFGPSPVRDANSMIPVSSAPPPPSIMLDPESVAAHAANYQCRNCGHNASCGDMKESMKANYPNDDDSTNESRARSFGWTPETPYHFFEVIRHVQNRTMHFVCRSCYVQDPFREVLESNVFQYQYRNNSI